MILLKSLLLKYRWYVWIVIAVAALLIVSTFVKSKSSQDRLLRWVSKRRLKIVEDALKDKKSYSQELKSKIKNNKEDIDDIAKRVEEIDGTDYKQDAKVLSEIWSRLGY